MDNNRRSAIPAAHSMDTEWFAVDDQGHVARLDTYEGGAVPKEGGFPHGDSGGGPGGWIDETELLTAALRLVVERDPEVASVLGEFKLAPDEVAHGLRWLHNPEGLQNAYGYLGLFVYECESQSAAPYARQVIPDRPLLFSELPEGVRSSFQPGFWPERFEDTQLIQPAEATECTTWNGFWVDREGQMHVREGHKREPDAEVGAVLVTQARDVEVRPADREGFLYCLRLACERTIDRRKGKK